MADWRQIQARIRKAKNAQDAHAKLSELFQRTRDAMVAWELALIEEKAERTEEAARWYTIAAQRFRRADWKKKAEEALTRLGVALPASSEEAAAETYKKGSSEVSEHGKAELPLALGEISHIPEAVGAIESRSETRAEVGGAADTGEAGKKRRRGRRGGRGRRRKGSAAPGLPSQAFAEPSAPPAAPVMVPHPRPHAGRVESFERTTSATFATPEPPRRVHEETAPSAVPSERTAHGRAGDPALASRLVHLESMLRRLVSSPLHRLEEADEAPAGPGVFLVSDSDQITSYYVEACQTLRVGLGNLVRGGRGGTGKSTRGGRGYSADTGGLKARLAEHLGISEAKVSQYLKDHCVVRWIQLDDDAPLLAHFAISVLRTPLNMD